MARPQLPIASLPMWQTLNDVTFVHTCIASIPGMGFGLVPMRSLSTCQPTFHRPSLLSVPHDLVLNQDAVEGYAKQDRNFRQLLDKAGHQSPRGDVLLYLLVQLVLGMKSAGNTMALPTPWTEYVKFLPDDVPLPTLWTDDERLLLQGTSLESAVAAKLVALEYEFDALRESSSDLPFWQAAFWDDSETGPELHHWFLLDAWYRSRSLELPQSGVSMVPCLDMVNHSATPNAYYEEEPSVGHHGNDVVLLMRPQQYLTTASEISISYSGDGHKSASEMLFSYGFVDSPSSRNRLVLPFRPFPDDPLAKAKLHVFGSTAPRLEVEEIDSDSGGDDSGDDNTASTRWTCPFAYLMCINEEDGLDFRLRQETDGTTQLRAFWQDVDVTDEAHDFARLTKSHALAAVFHLRVVTVIQEVMEGQLERMRAAAEADATTIRSEVAEQAELLRDIESRILSRAVAALEAQRSDLLTDETVIAYLGSMEVAENKLAGEEAPNGRRADDTMDTDTDDDDFS